MPLGDLIADTIGQAIGELIVYGISYWTGYVFLSIISLGQLNMAPLSTISEKNLGKKKWHQIDWSIWLRRKNKRALKAEMVCLAGIAVWIVAGIGIYFALSNEEAIQTVVSTPFAALTA
ncbi:MAG: hypothetical protein AAF546_09360 [Verrucomicrobiota bacterium]